MRRFPIIASALLALPICVLNANASEFSGVATLTSEYIYLPLLVDGAMDKLMNTESRESERIDRYKEYRIDDTMVNNILIHTLDSGVISGGKIPRVLQEWREPQHREFQDRTMWSLLNAYTEVLKPRPDGSRHRRPPFHPR